MEGAEEGECSSEDDIGQYTPLERPVQAKPSFRTNPAEEDSDSEPPELPCNTDSDSDGDGGRPTAKRRNTARPWGRRDALVAADPGVNTTFNQMAAAFQAQRKSSAVPPFKRKNNIWGTIIQEETLNTDLLGVGVGRSLKDLDSDRGAETYDYTLVAAEKAREREREEKGRTAKGKDNLDNEMDEYWSKSEVMAEVKEDEDDDASRVAAVEHSEATMMEENGEEKRGTKRSAKDRLGGRRIKLDRYKDEKLAGPGEPKQLIDIGDEEALEGSDQDFGRLLADRLGEDKPELIERVVTRFGRPLALNLYRLVQQTEAKGGMVIHNGARRRTSGGIFLLLLKTEPNLGVDPEAVKKLLADTRRHDERKILEAKKKKKKKQFSQELEDFLQLRRELAEQKASAGPGSGQQVGEEEEGEDGEVVEEAVALDVSPFANLVASMCGVAPEQQQQAADYKPAEGLTLSRLGSFKEPEAPPNSVERPLLDYEEDDFITSAGDTESIELF